MICRCFCILRKRIFAEIIKAYDAQKASGKQVFIAFDRLDKYDTETQETMNTNCVLELSPGGNELFGRAWNKETELEEDGENKSKKKQIRTLTITGYGNC